MKADDYIITKDGVLTIGSIFELQRSYFDVSPLIQECTKQNCTLRFENEGITIKPGDYDNDGSLRAQITAYCMVAAYPQTAIDYTRDCYSLAGKKKDPNAE